MPGNKAHDAESVGSDNERIPKSTYEIYRAEADALLRNSEFVKATNSYTKALDLRPGDRHCLVNRSKCHLRNDMTEEALKDVEESLKDDQNYYKGVFQKAEVLYFKGDFETALVYYHRGNKLRPELEDFRLGIQKAEEAINNSVGDSQVVLTCDGDLSYFYQHQEKSKRPRGGGGGGYGRQKQAPEKKKIERKKQTMDEKTQKKLLGSLYKDVEFLNHMVKDEKHTTHKTQNSEEINTLAIEALNFLESRTEFWQQQSPARVNKRQDSGKERPSNVQPARYVLNGLEEIDRKQALGHHEEALKQARQILRHVEGWTEKDLTNRQEVLANLHSIMGNCYLDIGNVSKALNHHKKDLEIGKANELEDAISRATDNIGRCHAKKGDYQAAIDIWQEKIPKSQSGLESAWLLHEIGRCYLELSEYQKSKEYGEKSLTSAQEIEDNSWMLNASVLIAQAEVKLKDYQAALDSFERALERAELINNREAEAAIKKAINDVNNEIVRCEKERENTDSLRGDNAHNADQEEEDHDSVHGSHHEKEDDAKSVDHDSDQGHAKGKDHDKDSDHEKDQGPAKDQGHEKEPEVVEEHDSQSIHEESPAEEKDSGRAQTVEESPPEPHDQGFEEEEERRSEGGEGKAQDEEAGPAAERDEKDDDDREGGRSPKNAPEEAKAD